MNPVVRTTNICHICNLVKQVYMVPCDTSIQKPWKDNTRYMCNDCLDAIEVWLKEYSE